MLQIHATVNTLRFHILFYFFFFFSFLSLCNNEHDRTHTGTYAKLCLLKATKYGD